MKPEAVYNRVAGYAFLIEKYRLNVIPNWHASLVSQSSFFDEYRQFIIG